MPSPGVEPLSTLIAAFVTRDPLSRMNVEGVFVPEEVVDAVRAGPASSACWCAGTGEGHRRRRARHGGPPQMVLVTAPGSFRGGRVISGEALMRTVSSPPSEVR